MNNNKNSQSFPAAQQTYHNTTSWLGHRSVDQLDVASGQTFLVNNEGKLDNIEVFSTVITSPGMVHMTLHQYDTINDSWGPSLGSATVEVNAGVNDKWLAFKMPGLHLDKGVSYGFRLESSDTYIGIGEAVGSANNPPYESGKEWRFYKNDKKSDRYSYFSLAFKVGLCA